MASVTRKTVGDLRYDEKILCGDQTVVNDENKINTAALAFSKAVNEINDLQDEATVADITAAFNKLLQALRAPALALMAAFSVFSGMCESLAPDDPDGVQFRHVPGTTNIYTKEQIDYLLKHIDGAEKNYAMLVIPLNRTEDENFVNFELKASTNNFTASVSTNEWEKWTFWSIGTTADNTAVQETLRNDGMLLYHENGTNADLRSYVYIKNLTQLPCRISSCVVVVDPARCFTHLPAKGWLKNSNDELIWTYRRVHEGGSPETDVYGNNLWNPVIPTRWFKELPAWAAMTNASHFVMH